jgi:putative nucleotidyltransferase with HDIG domain
MNTMTAMSPLSKEQESIITFAGDLPAMPMIATKVMQLVEDERATAEELAKVVAADPAVAAKVLKISNSAFYGCQREIKTLSGAIKLMGFNTLKSLVVAASLKEVIKPYGLTEKMLWEHSFGAGLAARMIAREIREVNPEEAFLAGLLQDIGKTVMHNYDRQKFHMVIEHSYNDGILFDEAERSVYPFSHAEIGGYVLKKWNLPEVLVTAVLHHHTFAFPDPDETYQLTITAIASLADQFCIKLGIGERGPRQGLALADTTAGKLLNLQDDQLAQMLDSFAEAYERDKSYFS